MKSKRLQLGVVWVMACLLAISVWLHVSGYLRDDGIKKLIFDNNIILSRSVVEAILSDMNVGGKARAEQWRAYLYSSTEYQSNYNAVGSTLRHTFAQYAANEKPGKSNLFNLLVWNLRMEQTTRPLSKQSVLGYLGQPDADIASSSGRLFQYQYWSLGRKYLASIAISNDTVSHIDIYTE